jgi:hypothetical protein
VKGKGERVLVTVGVGPGVGVLLGVGVGVLVGVGGGNVGVIDGVRVGGNVFMGTGVAVSSTASGVFVGGKEFSIVSVGGTVAVAVGGASAVNAKVGVGTSSVALIKSATKLLGTNRTRTNKIMTAIAPTTKAIVSIFISLAPP